MDRFEDDILFAELRELRPKPRPEFAAELDERAAAGFPRGERSSAAAMPFAKLADWWRGLTARRRLVPILGFALTVVAVATVVVASQSGSRLNVDTSEHGTLKTLEPGTSGAEVGGGGAEESAEAARGKFEGNFFGEGEAEAGSSAGAEESSPAQAEGQERLDEVRPFTKEAAPNQGRDIERSSSIVLGTKPGEVSAAAAKVFEAVHAADGFVLSSSVQSGTTGATGATFQLSIPSAKVNSALAAISSIAEVRERHDATNDITAPTVSAAEELADSNAAIEGLLKQLGAAETEAEQESVEARLREERRHHAAIRTSLDHLHQRASMSEVSLRIVTDHGAGVTPPSKGNGNWGVGDALHDAGHILTIAAGVVLIGLAVLAPFALIALLIWAANRFRVRRLRERALG